MQRLLAPLIARVGERMARSRVAPIGRRVAGTETGVLLGYLSQRVLGQYDLLVLDDDAVGRRGLLRRRQRPRVGEALRVPAARLPALDRDPRGHAPGAVHRRAVDEALLPVAGRERAVVDRSRPAAARAGARARRRRVAQRPQPARRRRPRRAPRQRGAARRAGQRAGADVAARGARQQRDEPARARARRRAGAHGAGAAGRAARARAWPRSCTSSSASSRRCASTRWGRRSSRRSSARPGPARIDAAWRGPECLPTVDELGHPARLARPRRRRGVSPRHRVRGGHRSRRGASGSPATCSGSRRPVVVACSGGADSVALLALARDAGPRAGRGARRPRPAAGSAHEADRGRGHRRASSVPGSVHDRVTVDAGPQPRGAGPRRAVRGARRRAASSSASTSCSSATRPTTRPRPCCSTCCGARPRPASRAWRRGADGSSCDRCSDFRRADTHALCAALGLDGARRPDERRPRVPPRRGPHDGAAAAVRALAGRDLVPVLARQADILAVRVGVPRRARDRGVARCRPPTARGARRALPRRSLARAVRRWLGAPPPSTAEVERVLAVAAGDARATELAGGRARPSRRRASRCSTRLASRSVDRDAIGQHRRQRGRAAARASASSARRSPPTTTAGRRCSSACSRARSCS